MAHILVKLDSIAGKMDAFEKGGAQVVPVPAQSDDNASVFGAQQMKNMMEVVQSLKVHQKLTLSSLQGLKAQMQENERRIIEQQTAKLSQVVTQQQVASMISAMGGDIKQALLRQQQQAQRQSQQ